MHPQRTNQEDQVSTLRPSHGTHRPPANAHKTAPPSAEDSLPGKGEPQHAELLSVVFREVRLKQRRIIALWASGLVAALLLTYAATWWLWLAPGRGSLSDHFRAWIEQAQIRRTARGSLLPLAGLIVGLLAIPALAGSPRPDDLLERRVRQIVLQQALRVGAFIVVIGAWLVAPIPGTEDAWGPELAVCALAGLLASTLCVALGIAEDESRMILVGSQRRLAAIDTRLEDLRSTECRTPRREWLTDLPTLIMSSLVALALTLALLVPGREGHLARTPFSFLGIFVTFLALTLTSLESLTRATLHARWSKDLDGRLWRYSQAFVSWTTAPLVPTTFIRVAFARLPAEPIAVVAELFALALGTAAIIVYPLQYTRLNKNRAERLEIKFLTRERMVTAATIASHERSLWRVESAPPTEPPHEQANVHPLPEAPGPHHNLGPAPRMAAIAGAAGILIGISVGRIPTRQRNSTAGRAGRA